MNGSFALLEGPGLEPTGGEGQRIDAGGGTLGSNGLNSFVNMNSIFGPVDTLRFAATITAQNNFFDDPSPLMLAFGDFGPEPDSIALADAKATQRVYDPCLDEGYHDEGHRKDGQNTDDEDLED